MSEQDLYTIADTCDFCYTVSDDSMTGDRILSGDLVFVQACSNLDNGDIALVDYNGEVRIGRYQKGRGYEALAPSNRAYMSLIEKEFCIIGKAVAFMSGIKTAQVHTDGREP